MEIKASCQLDFACIKDFNRFAMFKKANPKKRMITWAIVYAVLAALIILEMIAFDPELALYIALCVLAFIELLLCYSYFLLPYIRYKGMGKLKGAVNEYTFREDSIEVVSNNELANGRSLIKYTAFDKCAETSKYFFIFNGSQAFIVDKTTITGGTAEDIRNQLTCVVGKKYIICKY